MYMYIAESNVFYCILCLCIVTVVLLLYLAIWATISLNTLHLIVNRLRDKCIYSSYSIVVQYQKASYSLLAL